MWRIAKPCCQITESGIGSDDRTALRKKKEISPLIGIRSTGSKVSE
jgi:hypothetical protein